MKPCIDRRFVAHVPGRLDLPLMRTAAEMMLGEKDFAAFCAQSEKKVSTIRNIQQIHVHRSEESGIIEITVEGKSFLYNMVRIISGTLVSVGQGKIRPDQIEEIFALGDRRMAGKTMPARGLTLEKVFYDPEIF
jgi:tRNA pseudouridine38-40 synthase